VQPAGEEPVGWHTIACIAQVVGGSVSDASGRHDPPAASDPCATKPTPVPHPLTSVWMFAHVVPTVVLPHVAVQPPVPNWTVTGPHVDPEGGPQEHTHCAAPASGERPPLNVV
jgi:hypothetical protein